MFSKNKISKPSLVILITFVAFALIHCSTFFLSGDDFWWDSLDSASQLFSNNGPNGRYFTNAVTYFLIKYPIIRPLICSPFLILLFVLLKKISEQSEENSHFGYLVSTAIILLIPSKLAMFTTLWISGFTNYIMSIVFSLIYICLIFPVFDGRECKLSPLYSLLVFLIGVMGSLCVENITIYNIALALFVIIYSFVRFKKIRLFNISFLLGSVIGSVIMFSNANYHQISSSNGDQQGIRDFQFQFHDIFFSLYNDIAPLYSNHFVFVHISIALSLALLYFLKFGSLNKKESPKYARFFLTVIGCYAAYSFFSQVFSPLKSFTPSLRMNAILLAFSFLYIIGIIYMSFALFESSFVQKILFFISSMVLVTAPFVVVKPVTYRCFFAAYIFWSLVAASLIVKLFGSVSSNGRNIAAWLFSVSLSAISVFLSIIYISNYCTDRFRNSYIKEQVENGSRVIEIISLPYPEYCSYSLYDQLSELNSTDSKIQESDSYYGFMILRSMGIDTDLSGKSFIEVSLQDYFTSHSF